MAVVSGWEKSCNYIWRFPMLELPQIRNDHDLASKLLVLVGDPPFYETMIWRVEIPSGKLT